MKYFLTFMINFIFLKILTKKAKKITFRPKFLFLVAKNVLINVHLNTDSLSECFIFTIKSPILLKDWYLMKMILKRANSSPFFTHETKGSNNYFSLIENNIMVYKIVKFEFKVTVHHSRWGKVPSCLSLMMVTRQVYLCLIQLHLSNLCKLYHSTV